MLTVDPARRASAQQVFEAAQNLTDICLPQLNAPDRDGFKFPEMKHDRELEDFSQQPQLKPAQAPPMDSRKGDVAAANHVRGASNGSANASTQSAGNSSRQAGEDTSLVDNLLGEVKEEPTLEDKSSTMTTQS